MIIFDGNFYANIQLNALMKKIPRKIPKLEKWKNQCTPTIQATQSQCTYVHVHLSGNLKCIEIRKKSARDREKERELTSAQITV